MTYFTPELFNSVVFSSLVKPALKIIFKAEQPVCIPDRPTGKSNVITSSFAIPGTAVTGALLNILSQKDPVTASACFRSPVFRAGSLLPVGDNECLLPVRVSNSHKISKLAVNGAHVFGDLMIPDRYLEDEDYHWQKETGGMAMKGADGVLLIGRGEKKKISLLKAGNIPLYLSAHGVINGVGEKKDNLYSMEAVCVSRFEGIVFMPVSAAEKLLELLGKGVAAAFGKHKSTMGGGTLSAEKLNLNLEKDYPQVEQLRNRLFIVQSPVVFELEPGREMAGTREIMQKILSDADWGELEEESVMTSVLFGWNELKLGKQIGDTARVQACRVLQPGSVFLLKEPLRDMTKKLASGLGSLRAPGYGAVLPHPMFAEELAEVERKPVLRNYPSSKSRPEFDGYALDEQAGKKLSASQIAGLLKEVQTGRGLGYLKIQKENRPVAIWERFGKKFYEILEMKLQFLARENQREKSQPERNSP